MRTRVRASLLLNGQVTTKPYRNAFASYSKDIGQFQRINWVATNQVSEQPLPSLAWSASSLAIMSISWMSLWSNSHSSQPYTKQQQQQQQFGQWETGWKQNNLTSASALSRMAFARMSEYHTTFSGWMSAKFASPLCRQRRSAVLLPDLMAVFT